MRPIRRAGLGVEHDEIAVPIRGVDALLALGAEVAGARDRPQLRARHGVDAVQRRLDRRHVRPIRRRWPASS